MPENRKESYGLAWLALSKPIATFNFMKIVDAKCLAELLKIKTRITKTRTARMIVIRVFI